MIDIENYAKMILRNTIKAGLSSANARELYYNRRMSGIEMPNQSEFMLKTKRGDAEQKTVKIVKKTSRKMKVYGKWNYRKKLNPTIILGGAWLKEWGFEIDTPIVVQCENGKLTIMKQDVDNQVDKKTEG